VGGRHTGLGTPPEKVQAYFDALRAGMSQAGGARVAGISRHTARALEQRSEERARVALEMAQERAIVPSGEHNRRSGSGRGGANSATVHHDGLPGPKPANKLSVEARRGLEDFGYWRHRYLGRAPSPWQEDAAYRMVALLDSPAKEFVVVNAPPGPGKSTLFTHDLIAWVICRKRHIRVLVGSRTGNQAARYVMRIRRTLHRRGRAIPTDDELAKGSTVPEGELIKDYGRFKPLADSGLREVWAAVAFVVAQPGDVLVDEKEFTVGAFGLDSDPLGYRADLVIWDDLVDRKNIKTPEAREELVKLYETQAENRLEPGGLFILQGQRLSTDDLYRHCLDKRTPVLDERGRIDHTQDLAPRYHHIVYKAHYDDRCPGEHLPDDPPYQPDPTPEGTVLRGLFGYEAPTGGCLLDPYRLTWADLVAHQHNDLTDYLVIFQQEDVDPTRQLVQAIWLDGGTDPTTGEVFPGCYDVDRNLRQLPGIPERAALRSVATTDPAQGAGLWALQWWLYDGSTEQRFLVDLARAKLTAPDFLDWNHARGVWTGLMEEWWQRSEAAGHPIRHWIVEANAAQRFLLQYEHVRRWTTARGVTLVPHQTTVRKLDEERGPEILRPHYRYGRMRLPYGDHVTRARVDLLTHELVRYPDGATTDQVMANWFLEVHLPRLFPARAVPRQRPWRPSWLSPPRRELTGAHQR
jgi:hypothetical protein